MSDAVRTGRCLCGAVTYRYDPPENWRAHCHCESCRRATSSPVTTYMGVPRERLRWTGAEPTLYESSPGVRRLFCGRCGSPMAYDSDRFPHEVHLFAASLDDPGNFAPQAHVFFAEHLPWFDTADDLPRHARSGSE